MKSLVARRWVLGVIALGVVIALIWWAWVFAFHAPTPESATKPTNTTVGESSSDTSSFSVPVDTTSGEQKTDAASEEVQATAARVSSNGTATVTITTKPVADPSTTPSSTPPDSSQPAQNTPPTLTTVSPTTASYATTSTDTGRQYKALLFKASATDKEDGAIASPSSFHWSNTAANCTDAGIELCQNEVDGNNFTMNMPVSGVCSGVEAIDLSDTYKFIVTVRDSGGLTDSREIDLTITYHCTATPPELTIVSPVEQRVYTMSDAGSGTYWIDGIKDPDHWRAFHQLLFNATATDATGAAITDPTAYTWQLVSGECNPTYDVPTGLLCQTETQGNNFLMNLTPGLVSGPEETYVFDVTVRDSYGNSTTKRLTFGVVPYDYQSSGQGN